MSTIKLQPKDWASILVKIEQEYGRAIALISWAMKRELGFKVRNIDFGKRMTTLVKIILDLVNT